MGAQRGEAPPPPPLAPAPPPKPPEPLDGYLDDDFARFRDTRMREMTDDPEAGEPAEGPDWEGEAAQEA